MVKPKLKKLFKCAMCKFECDDIETLQSHTYQAHVCLLCNRTYFCKLYHKCKVKKTTLVGGGGSQDIDIPSTFTHVSGSFKDVIVTFSHKFTDNFELISDAINSIKSDLHKLIKSYINHHTGIRLKIALELLFNDIKHSREVIKLYPSPALRIHHKDFIDPVLLDCVNYISALCELLAHNLSGLILIKCLSLNATIMKFSPKKGNGYIPLGPCKNKKGIICSRVKDNCFAASVLLALHTKDFKTKDGNTYFNTRGYEKMKIKRHLEKKETAANLIMHSSLKYSTLNYGEDLSLLGLFESSNLIGVNVYKYSLKEKGIVTIRACQTMYETNISLLMLYRSHLPLKERKHYHSQIHFAAIVCKDSFFAIKKKKYLGFCDYCTSYYTSPTHTIQCLSGIASNYTVPSKLNYRFTGLHRMLVPQISIFFTFIYGNKSAKENVIDLFVLGYGLVGINALYQETFSNFYVGSDALDNFYDYLLVNCNYYLDTLVQNQLPLVVSKEERDYMKKIKSCFCCGRSFDGKDVIVVCNHHHHQLISNNFPCRECNNMYYNPRRIICFTNDLDINGKFLLDNINEKALKNVFIIPKSGSDGFLSITLQNKITFFDTTNHLLEKLHKAMQCTDADDFYLLIQHEPINHKYFSRHLAFPHTFIQCVGDLQGNFPSAEQFQDIMYTQREMESAYEHAKLTYNIVNCENLLDYANACLKSNTYGIADLMINYSRFLQNIFTIHPWFDVSLSSYSYNAAHYISKSNYHNLNNLKIYEAISQGLMGGISLSVQKLVQCVSKRFGDDVSDQDTVECVYLDYNKEFLFLLGEKIPYSDYHFYTPDQVETFKLSCLYDDNDIHYILHVDMHYPNEIKTMTQFFPLLPTKTFITAGDVQKLYCNTEKLCNDNQLLGMSKIQLTQQDKKLVWVSHTNLKLYIKLGMQLTKIHNIISYKVSNHFLPFREKCSEAITKSKNSVHALICKSLANHTVGYLMSKCFNQRVVVCTEKQKAIKLLYNNNFVNAESVTADMMIIALKKKRSLITKNILISFHILEESKRLLYQTYYCELMPVFRNRLSLVLCDTDSLLIKITGASERSLYDDLKKLSHIIEYSQVPKEIIDLHDNSRKGQIGMMKIESIRIRSVVSLRAKQFSILETCIPKCDPDLKIGCEGCNRHIMKGIRLAQAVTHEKFMRVLCRDDDGVCDYDSITKSGTSITFMRKNRKFLSVCDSGRLFISENTTVPIGFFDVNK